MAYLSIRSYCADLRLKVKPYSRLSPGKTNDTRHTGIVPKQV